MPSASVSRLRHPKRSGVMKQVGRTLGACGERMAAPPRFLADDELVVCVAHLTAGGDTCVPVAQNNLTVTLSAGEFDLVREILTDPYDLDFLARDPATPTGSSRTPWSPDSPLSPSSAPASPSWAGSTGCR